MTPKLLILAAALSLAAHAGGAASFAVKLAPMATAAGAQDDGTILAAAGDTATMTREERRAARKAAREDRRADRASVGGDDSHEEGSHDTHEEGNHDSHEDSGHDSHDGGDHDSGDHGSDSGHGDDD